MQNRDTLSSNGLVILEDSIGDNESQDTGEEYPFGEVNRWLKKLE
jgi:hypothetical protein